MQDDRPDMETDPDRWTVPLTDDVTVDELDARITEVMNSYGPEVLRYALGIVFVWFGALKVLGVSPADDLVAATVYFLPPELFVPILGVWEVCIGGCLLVKRFIRPGLFLLALQLPGTFLPVVVRPEVVFTVFPYGLTVEGQYIVKNFVIIGAALVVGGYVRARQRLDEDKPPHTGAAGG